MARITKAVHTWGVDILLLGYFRGGSFMSPINNLIYHGTEGFGVMLASRCTLQYKGKT